MDRLTFNDGAYRTNPRKVSLLARKFPSSAFYPHLFAAVFAASFKAERSRYTDEDWAHTSLRVLRALEGVGVQFEITGVNYLQQLQTPCVIVANHMSTLETAVLPSIIEPIRRVTFVVKQSLLDYPVFKHVMRSREPVAVTQTDARHDLKTTLVEGVKRLEAGISIVVFPQGRRTFSFEPAQFNTIGVKLAHRAGVPMLPLALKTDAWALGRRLMDFGRIDPAKRVRFAFGEPISVNGRGTDEHRAVIEFIQAKLDLWRTDSS
jgi:1-acyl-sn-glycerol-3-phosphate acyltransferase